MFKLYINGKYLTQKQTGSQRNSYELTVALFKIFPEIIILTPNIDLNKSYNIDNLNIKKIGFNKGALWEQLDLVFFLKNNKNPLLINLTNTAPFLYKRQIVSIMDMTTFVNPKWFSNNFARYYQFLIPKIIKNSLLTITISEHSKRDIHHFVNITNKKVKVINCSVSNSFKLNADKTSIETNNLLEKLNIKNNEFFLAVSSLDPRKNFKMLIKAYNELKTNSKLVIVGSKGATFNNNDFDTQLKNDKIIFTGYISDDELIILYKTALCFVYPSLYEGFGIPPLEAMACNCPTIVSNTSSLPEVCGNASLYIDPYNIQSIVEAMKQITLHEGLREELIAKGKKQVEKFSWNKSAQQLALEINKLL